MKKRIGFVSNSSSSSFILLVDKEFFDKKSACPCCGEQKKFYFNSKCFIDSEGSCGDNSVDENIGFKAYIEELEEAKERVDGCNYFMSEEEEKYEKQKVKAQIDENIEKIKLLEKENKDKVLFRVYISYHDDTSKWFLKSMVKDGKVIVVDKDE